MSGGGTFVGTASSPAAILAQPSSAGVRQTLQGRYLLLYELGVGAMVALYRGFDNLISKDVSVKTLIPGKASNAALLAQILKEVALAQVVTHPKLRRLLSNTGAVKLSDYGVASTTREQLRGAPQAGTPPYMEPEQLRGERVDARVDLYAAGMMAFEFLTGGFPFALTS